MYSPLEDIDHSRNWTLPELSQEKAESMTFSVVYLSIVTFVGIVGNVLVLKIFYTDFQPSTHRTFILALALLDLIACAVGIPFSIVQIFLAFTFTDAVSCKFFRFILYSTSIASGLTLDLIAIERFRKICKPLKPQLTVIEAKKALVGLGFVTVLSAVPGPLLYGNASVPTGYKNVNGVMCFISDSLKETIWPVIYNVYLLLLVVLSVTCMSVCYISIAKRVRTIGKQHVMRRVDSNDKNEDALKSSTSVNTLDFGDEESEPDSNLNRVSLQLGPEIDSRQTADSVSISSKNGVRTAKTATPDVARTATKKGIASKISTATWKNAKHILLKSSKKSGKKTIRITKMLTFVTITFIVSYTPHLVLMCWQTIVLEDESLPTDNMFQVIFTSFILNNLINPFIYAAMDLKFRSALKVAFKCDKSKI